MQLVNTDSLFFKISVNLVNCVSWWHKHCNFIDKEYEQENIDCRGHFVCCYYYLLCKKNGNKQEPTWNHFGEEKPSSHRCICTSKESQYVILSWTFDEEMHSIPTLQIQKYVAVPSDTDCQTRFSCCNCRVFHVALGRFFYEAKVWVHQVTIQRYEWGDRSKKSMRRSRQKICRRSLELQTEDAEWPVAGA